MNPRRFWLIVGIVLLVVLGVSIFFLGNSSALKGSFFSNQAIKSGVNTRAIDPAFKGASTKASNKAIIDPAF